MTTATNGDRASVIPAEPPVVSLRRLVEVTGLEATLQSERATVTLCQDKDTLTMSTFDLDPVGVMVEQLHALLPSILGPDEHRNRGIEVELKVRGITNLLVSQGNL